MLRPGFIGAISEWSAERLAMHPKDLKKAFTDFGIQELLDAGEDIGKIEGLFSEWVIFDNKSRTFNGKTGIQYFVEYNPLKLPESDIAAYSDMLDFKVGFFDIAKIETGKVILKDDDGSYEVADINASMNLKAGATVWCRIAKVDGIYQMTSSTMIFAPITILGGMKAILAGLGRNMIDAREAARWSRGSRSLEEKAIHPHGGGKKMSAEEAACAFDEALEKAGMQRMLSSATVKMWTENERRFRLGFPMKALFFLLPEDVTEEKRDAVLSALNDYLNNLPRCQLKSKTPKEAYESGAPDDRHFEVDAYGYADYGKDLQAAHVLKGEGRCKEAYKAYEVLTKRLLEEKVPLITSFRIYANAALCLLEASEGTDTLGYELTRACLRLNPLYDFGLRQKKRLLDPMEDVAGLSKKEVRLAKGLLKWARDDGERRYRRTAFRKYEDFLATCGISLTYATTTTPTVYKDGAHVNVGRNDPCLCGSGKKFKECCMH